MAADSAPEFAVEALSRAMEGRGAIARSGVAEPGTATELADGTTTAQQTAITVPSLNFKFRSPNFLSNRSRWVLFVLLIAVAVIALVLAWDMVRATGGSEGVEWIWPPIFTLVVAAIAIACAFADVMGFGSVDLVTSIGESTAATAGGLQVTGTVPEDKATDIAVDVEIEATFSEAIDKATLTSQTFVLRIASDGTAVATTVSSDPDAKTGRLKPAAPLTASTTYSVEITGGVTSATGAALAASKTWSFKTGA